MVNFLLTIFVICNFILTCPLIVCLAVLWIRWRTSFEKWSKSQLPSQISLLSVGDTKLKHI